MKTHTIISAGIDIGTSTTQLIFSRLTLQEATGFGVIPQTEIINKEVFYRSPISFTPLLPDERIDGEKTALLIQQAYKDAGIEPSMLTTGAVIITGESNRKKNAREVLEAISAYAGDFVSASAGPELESVLAGKGSGAASLSDEKQTSVINIDIGGGTSNLCCFTFGEVTDTACLDIGGRQIKFSNGLVSYIAPKTQLLAKRHGIDIREGSPANFNEINKICCLYADILAQACNLKPATDDLAFMTTSKVFSHSTSAEIITLSGGVAACITELQNSSTCNMLKYGDIGFFLAKAIMESECLNMIDVCTAEETVRATVIGAGNFSTAISGSTIDYNIDKFPIKNIPVGKIKLENNSDIENILPQIETVLDILDLKNTDADAAIAFEGIPCPTFHEIQAIASAIMTAIDSLMKPEAKCIIISRSDTGKALGQALRRVNKNKRSILCIDQISSATGDYLDIGKPLASGKVIPVIVKTLVFR